MALLTDGQGTQQFHLTGINAEAAWLRFQYTTFPPSQYIILHRLLEGQSRANIEVVIFKTNI